MNAGRLRNIVTIQNPVRSINDDTGQPVITWENFATGVYAEIRSTSGKEFYAQDQVKNVATNNILIRWLDGVDETMRVVWGDRIFNIVHVGEDRTHKKLMPLVCFELKTGDK